MKKIWMEIRALDNSRNRELGCLRGFTYDPDDFTRTFLGIIGEGIVDAVAFAVENPGRATPPIDITVRTGEV